MFPGLLPCEVDLESAVGLGRVASRMDATLPVVDEALENASYRNAEPGWRPTLAAAKPGEFGMADLVVFAGMAGASR